MLVKFWIDFTENQDLIFILEMGRKEIKILWRWDKDHLSSSDPLGPRQERIVAKEKEMAEGRDVRQNINRLNSLNNDCCS